MARVKLARYQAGVAQHLAELADFRVNIEDGCLIESKEHLEAMLVAADSIVEYNRASPDGSALTLKAPWPKYRTLYRKMSKALGRSVPEGWRERKKKNPNRGSKVRRLIPNGRLTVADKQVVLEMADAGASTAQMAAAVDTHPSTIKRFLIASGVSRGHGGSRGGIWATGEEGAGQKGKGSATSAERIELTPEMVWVDALARMYGLGLSDEQYHALVGAFPALKDQGKRKSPQERLDLLHGTLEDFYPRLVGKKLGKRDMGEDVLAAFNSSYLAIRSELPVQPPIDDLSTLAAFEEQVAVGEMGGGTRVVRRRVTEDFVAPPAAFWPAGQDPPSETPVTAAPHPKSLKFKRMMEQRLRQKEEGSLEALERASGVIRIDPQQYLAEQALRDELEAMRAEGRIKSLPAPKHLVAPGLSPLSSSSSARYPTRNPDASRDDAASTALAMLRLSGSVMPPRKARKKKAKKARPSRAAFRRLMRI